MEATEVFKCYRQWSHFRTVLCSECNLQQSLMIRLFHSKVDKSSTRRLDYRSEDGSQMDLLCSFEDSEEAFELYPLYKCSYTAVPKRACFLICLIFPHIWAKTSVLELWCSLSHCSSLFKGFFWCQKCVQLFMSAFHVFSLAVHPDKITIATGQVAGTSSDGKVSMVSYRCFIILPFNIYHLKEEKWSCYFLWEILNWV